MLHVVEEGDDKNRMHNNLHEHVRSTLLMKRNSRINPLMNELKYVFVHLEILLNFYYQSTCGKSSPESQGEYLQAANSAF